MSLNDNILATVLETIKSRRDAEPETSYTAQLFNKGIQKIAQKVGEEAIEVALAAVSGDKDEVISESADLIFHLMVLWEQQGVSPEDVLSEIARRQGVSGLEEKASRKK